MKWILNKIKEGYNWMRSDGLIHALMCYSIFLALAPIIGVNWARGVVILLALGKEAIDFFIEKDNDLKEVGHDLICDAIGIAGGDITILIWSVFV